MSGNTLIHSLVAEFRRGIALIERLSDSVYAGKHGDAGSIGEHFRHNLEFGTKFLEGVETGRIDYADRARDPRVEDERVYAVGRYESLINAILELADEDPKKAVAVRSEIDEKLWLPSSLARELEFLHSHTVHHYALIAAKLRTFDIEVDNDFGVAPSTLEYWNSKRKSAATL